MEDRGGFQRSDTGGNRNIDHSPSSKEQHLSLTADQYKGIMARYPSGVTVVTATDTNGKDFGLTVSAFTAASLEPPLVLVCVDTSSNTLPAIRESQAFTVNILEAGKQDIAIQFASKDSDKFLAVNVENTSTGPVLVSGVVAYLRCRVESQIEAGDHSIFVGLVEDARVIDESRQGLLFCDRAFWRMVAVD